MFEQATVDTRGMLTSPWAMTASVAGQALVFGAGILISLLHTDALPKALFIPGRIAAPGPHVKVVDPPHGSVVRQSRTAIRPFIQPTNISPLRVSNSREPASVALMDIPLGMDAIGLVGNGAGGDEHFMGFEAALPQLPPPPPAQHPQEKRAAPVPRDPVHVSSGVQAAKLLRQVKPVYPPLARQARISGTVRLVAIIGRDGAIQNLQVASGHPLLTTAAVEAVKQWLYRPTMLNEQPVEVITQIDVNFTLSN